MTPGQELLGRAAQRVFDRKQAALASDEPGGAEFVKDAMARAGVDHDTYTRRLLSGMDLEPDDMASICAGYVDAVFRMLEQSGEMPPLAGVLGSAFFEGLLLGVYLERERLAAENTVGLTD